MREITLSRRGKLENQRDSTARANAEPLVRTWRRRIRDAGGLIAIPRLNVCVNVTDVPARVRVRVRRREGYRIAFLLLLFVRPA